MGDMRFKDKSGRVKYIATDKGSIKHIGKDGKVKELFVPKTGKDEHVEITKRDLNK